MKIIIRGEPKEIAALVLELQERRDGTYEIKAKVDTHAIATSVLEAMQSMKDDSVVLKGSKED